MKQLGYLSKTKSHTKIIKLVIHHSIRNSNIECQFHLNAFMIWPLTLIFTFASSQLQQLKSSFELDLFNNMPQQQKEIVRKSNANNDINSSDSFRYDEDCQRHIGKRTGKHIERAQHRQHFDGFPRLSEYESCGDINAEATAKGQQNYQRKQTSTNKNSLMGRQSIERESNQFEFVEPLSKDQHIVDYSGEDSKHSDVSNNHVNEFMGISSIKKNRQSSVRKSELLTYRKLVNDIQEQAEHDYQLNSHEIGLVQGQKFHQNKDENIDHNQGTIHGPFEAKRSQEHQMGPKRKPKNTRVSFKENPITNIDYAVSQNSLQNEPGQQQRMRQANYQIESRDRMSERLSDAFNFKQPQTANEEQERQHNQISNPYLNKRNAQQCHEQTEFQFRDNQCQAIDNLLSIEKDCLKQQTINRQSLPLQSSNCSSKVMGRGKIKNQKQIRVGNESTNKIIRSTNSRKGKSSLGIGKQQQKASSSAITKLKKTTKNGNVSDRKVTKVQIKNSRRHNFMPIEEMCDENPRNRYPKRRRVKTLQFWENQKIQYKNGRAVGLRSTHLDLRKLIGLPEEYQSTVQVDLTTGNIKAALKLPTDKQIECTGFSAPFCELLIRLKAPSSCQILLDNGIRIQEIDSETWAPVSIDTRFTIESKNWEDAPRKSVMLDIMLIQSPKEENE